MLEKNAFNFDAQDRGSNILRFCGLTAETETPNSVVLAVGDVLQCQWYQASNTLPDNSRISIADFADINADLLEKLKPSIVLSCLVCRNYDFIDLGEALQAANFQGCFRIFAPKLPNPGIVVLEARLMCPKLNFDFVFDALVPVGSIN